MIMFRDDEFAPAYMSPPFEHPAVPTISSDDLAAFNSATHLDDVFGSAPGSPVEGLSAGEEEASYSYNQAREDPSDIPRMRSQHSTAGYRDGIAVAKGKYVQAGFDEGFGLGAVIGLRIGEMLGILEGIANAATSHSTGGKGGDQIDPLSITATSHVNGPDEIESTRRMADMAGKELSLERVFGPEYWGVDGVWKFHVRNEQEDSQVTFSDVADAHPLIAKWQIIVHAALGNAHLPLKSLDDTDRDRE